MSFSPVIKEFNTKTQKKLTPQDVSLNVNINSNGFTIKQVLSIDLNPKVENIILSNGSAEISGKSKVKLLVATSDNSYNLIEDEIGFSTLIRDSDIIDGSKILSTISLKQISNVSATENVVTFNANMIVLGVLLKQDVIKYVESIDALTCHKIGQLTFFDTYSTINQSFDCTNEVTLPNNVSKILSIYGNCMLEKSEAKTDILSVEGKIYANVVFLTNEDEPKLKSQEYVLDFSQELLSNGSVEEDCVNANCVLNNISFEVEGELNSSKGVLTIKTDICVLATLSKKNEINAVVDAFCPKYNLASENGSFSTQSIEKITLKEKIDGTLSLSDDVQVDKVLCVSNAFITKNIVKEGKVYKIEGVLHANILYRLDDENQTVGAIVAQIPFTKQLDGEFCDIVFTEVCLCGVEARSKRIKDIDIQADIEIAASCITEKVSNVIADVKLAEKIDTSESAMGVYFVTNANELWDVAKLLKINPEILRQQNPNLSFPISQPTPILVYRKNELAA